MERIRIEPFNIIGIAVKTTNAGGQGVKDIAMLWQKFMSENIPEKIPNKIDNTIYSLYTDYEGDYTQPYITILGCKTENLNIIPEGMVGRSFGGGNYVKLSAKGDLSKGLVANQWHKIWNMDLDRIYTVDFEVFGEKALNPQDAEIDFLIAVK